MRFSYSQVSMYESNPWKHFCSYVMGLYPPASEQADRGTNVHCVFEKIALKCVEDKTTNPIEFLDSWHNNTELEEKDMINDETWTIVRRYLINYAGLGNGLLAENRLPWKDAVKIEVEKKVTTTFNGIDFIGYIDLVVYNEDGTISLYDYKTLSNKPSIYEYVNGMQGNLYIAAMEQLGHTVKEFIFDAMNPKMNIPWNGYRFFRVELDANKNRVDNSVKRFVHLANQIMKNPSYHNTFGGWSDELHIDAWNALMKSPEDFYMFCQNHGVEVASKLTESIAKGYPVPYFFTLEGDTPEEQEEINVIKNNLNNKFLIVKTEIGNRKNPGNWSDEDIKQEFDFDFLLLGNSKGWRQFNKDYSEVNLLSDEEINSLEIGDNYVNATRIAGGL